MSQKKLTDAEYAKRINKLRSDQEAVIKRVGYVIQGVTDGKKSYMYSYGRNDKGLHDFVIVDTSVTLAHIINEAVDILNKAAPPNEAYAFGQLEESRIFICKTKPKQKTLFKIVQVDPSMFTDKCLGIFNRGKPVEQIKLCQILVADRSSLTASLGV